MSTKAPEQTQTFGFRSYQYIIGIVLLLAVLALFFTGVGGFIFVLLIGTYMNLDAIDMMKITLDDELLHVTRYIPLTQYDCQFWLKDIKDVGVYLKVKAGKSRARFLPFGTRNSTSSWYIMHVVMKDGNEMEVPILGMAWFERKMLKKALAAKGIESFEVVYRYNKNI